MRLVAVVAVIAGLVLLQAPRCTDGMVAGMSMAAGASPAMIVGTSHDDGAPLAIDGVPGHPQDAAAVAADESGSGGMGSVLATCLAFLVLVLVAVAGLASGGLRAVVRVRPAGLVAMVRTIPLRAPSLAQLCVLRT